MKFSIKDYLIKCNQFRSFLRIWSHLMKKSLMENFTFCAVLCLLKWSFSICHCESTQKQVIQKIVISKKYFVRISCIALRKKCPYSEFLLSVFSRIQTEYGEIRSISTYLVQMWENKDQKNSEYGHFSRSVGYKK